MDTETVIASVQKTGRCVVVEEGWQQSGVGAEVAARIMEQAFDYLDAPVARVSGKDVPMPYAANLEKLALPSVAEVVDAAKAVMLSVKELGMPYDALNPPPMVAGQGRASRCCAPPCMNGELHFSLRRGFADPAAWGMLFVDAARHVARVYAHEKMFTEDEALERIRAGLRGGDRRAGRIAGSQTTEIKETQ